MTSWKLLAGDCIEVMAGLEDASVDAVVTDPPYGIGFMGHEWDQPGEHGPSSAGHGGCNVSFGGAPHPAMEAGRYDLSPTANLSFQRWCAAWGAEALRLLKPGGHAVVFGSTRTYHRLASGLEDAGFEIRDTLAWMFGSGFPKSRNLDGDWEGWGTALKPGYEPIVLARKPLRGTVAANVAAHGTGALHIDATRIATADSPSARRRAYGVSQGGAIMADRTSPERYAEERAGEALGRWPANVLLDEPAAAELDEQTGTLTSGKMRPTHTTAGVDGRNVYGADAASGFTTMETYGDAGGASRFFYVGKATQAERGASNTHPTVKPVAIMAWLVRLLTPPNGLVLDPFTGSGTTGIAAVREGMAFVGIEREPAYLAIARDRILDDAPLFNAALEAA